MRRRASSRYIWSQTSGYPIKLPVISRENPAFWLMYVSFTRWAYEAVVCGVFHAGWGPLSRDDIFDEYGYPTSGVALGLYALPLEPFGRLPRLKDLALSCNGIRALAGPLEGFERLVSLDLSYNALPPAAVGRLAALPQLRELDLTSNELAELPPVGGAAKDTQASSQAHGLDPLLPSPVQQQGKAPLWRKGARQHVPSE